MLTDFLQKSVQIYRKSDSIYDGDLEASLDFTQLSIDSFLVFTVSDEVTFSITTVGLDKNGAAVTEVLTISDGKGNRGFQKFSSINSISCIGELVGQIRVRLLNDTSEPNISETLIDTVLSDSSYKPLDHRTEVFGEEGKLPRTFKFYFESAVDIRENDGLVERTRRYRVEDVVPLDSITGISSHKEALVTKLKANEEF